MALSRELLGAGGDGEVRREWAWLGLEASGAPRTGIIDRVVVQKGGGGAARRAFVIDWKTDRVAGGAHQRHAERYRHQLTSYQGAVADLIGLDFDDVTTYVVFVRDGVSVELGPEPGSADSDQ